MEGVATGASKQTRPVKHKTRELATTWNAPTPFRSGANTSQPLDLNWLKLTHIMHNKIKQTE
jgi:hypothetical protein